MYTNLNKKIKFISAVTFVICSLISVAYFLIVAWYGIIYSGYPVGAVLFALALTFPPVIIYFALVPCWLMFAIAETMENTSKISSKAMQIMIERETEISFTTSYDVFGKPRQNVVGSKYALLQELKNDGIITEKQFNKALEEKI